MAAPTVFGTDPAKLVPFQESADDGDRFALKDWMGDTMLIDVKGVEDVKTANYGVKPAIRCDVVVLGEEGEDPAKFTDALIFNAAPVDQLRAYPGQRVIVKCVAYTSKSGTKAPKFEAPDAAGQKRAEAYAA